MAREKRPTILTVDFIDVLGNKLDPQLLTVGDTYKITDGDSKRISFEIRFKRKGVLEIEQMEPTLNVGIELLQAMIKKRSTL